MGPLFNKEVPLISARTGEYAKHTDFPLACINPLTLDVVSLHLLNNWALSTRNIISFSDLLHSDAISV